MYIDIVWGSRRGGLTSIVGLEEVCVPTDTLLIPLLSLPLWNVSDWGKGALTTPGGRLKLVCRRLGQSASGPIEVRESYYYV